MITDATAWFGVIIYAIAVMVLLYVALNVWKDGD